MAAWICSWGECSLSRYGLFSSSQRFVDIDSVKCFASRLVLQSRCAIVVSVCECVGVDYMHTISYDCMVFIGRRTASDAVTFQVSTNGTKTSSRHSSEFHIVIVRLIGRLIAGCRSFTGVCLMRSPVN